MRAAGVVSSGATVAADYRACVLGLDLAGEGCVAGIVAEWSTCYDRMPLAVLREVAERSVLPGCVWRPMLDA